MAQVIDKAPGVDVIRTVEAHEELARAAREKADATDDPDLAIRLRETAIKHERMARKLRRNGA
jgi:hypothetical protein